MEAKILELREELGRLDRASTEILDAAQSAGRSLSEADKANWDRLDKQIKTVNDEIDYRERQANRTAQLEKGLGRKSQAPQPGRFNKAPETAPDAWRDARTGELIKSFGHGESIAEDMGLDDGPSVGDVALAELAKLSGTGAGLSIQNTATGSADTTGGYMNATRVSAKVLDLARSASVAMQAGVRVIPMNSETLRIVKVDTDPVAAWLSEGVQATATKPVFGKVTLRSRTLRCHVPVSEELLADAANSGSAITMAMRGALGLALDEAILFGGSDGDGESPTGLRNIDGTTEQGSVGALTNYDAFLVAHEGVLTANAPPDADVSVIMHPRTAGDLSRLKTGISSDESYLTPPDIWQNRMNQFQTTSISITEGSAESFAIVGPFSTAILGMRLNAQIFAQQKTDRTYSREIIAVLRADFVVPRPAFFQILTGITS